ncbi:MAG: triose-phosphate isomerase [Bdellovibrionales bacterium]
MKKLIVGNWKMNGSVQEAKALIAALINGLYADEGLLEGCKFAVCPPFLHIGNVRHALHGYPKIAIGAQDCSALENGAHTGDVSAAMLKDAGCRYVIVGHSERRSDHGESDADVKAKAEAVLKHDMIPIVCVGETLEQREAGEHLKVVEAQVNGSLPDKSFGEIVVAYEPVWAIGTGKVAGIAEIAEMHAHIRALVGRGVWILYGGSMKPDNAGEILAVDNVDGGLIGGASLDADSFLGIARAV